MRPDLDPEEKKAAVRKIRKNCLIGQAGASVPTDQGQQVIDAQGESHDKPFEVTELALNLFRENRFTRDVKAGVLISAAHGITLVLGMGLGVFFTS